MTDAPTAGVPTLCIRGLAHAYGDRTALAGVHLEVMPGERVGLLGPNGSGKTTLFRAVSTLLRPDAGTVEVDGHDAVREPLAVRRRLGVVFQDAALDRMLTVREALGLQAALVGAPASRVDDLLEALSLADRADSRVGTLSGGLARRTDLARGLLHAPALLLLDEPTTGLDTLARRELWGTLDALRATSAQLVATHLMDEAERCDRVVVLHEGQVVADATPDALRATLGGDTLWLDTPDASALAARLVSDGLNARAVGRQVLVTTDDAAGWLTRLYPAPDVTGAAVRRPTLEDAVAAATGVPLPSPTEVPA